MTNVALYIRVSTQEQAMHGLSLDDQRSSLERWAAENGNRVAGVYADEGISARKPASKRPALQKMLDDVRAGKIELIVFTKLDRWFRNVAEYYKVQEVLEQHNVDWRTIYEDYDTSTASGRLKINIMLSVAQDEADRTSERIKAINEFKRTKLEPLTGGCPLGYKIKEKKFIKDPERQKIVETIFEKFVSSGSIIVTIDYIMQEFGFRLNYQRTDRILRNTAYYGRYFGADGMCPPYITKEQYDTIQGMRRKVARKSPGGNVYLFSGMIFCGECGHRMSAAMQANVGKSKIYSCPWKYSRKIDCTNRKTPGERKIENVLLGSIEKKLEDTKSEKLAEWLDSHGKSYKPEIAAIKKRLEKLKELYLDDMLTMSEYKADRAAFESKLSYLQELDRPREMPNFEAMDAILSKGWKEKYTSLSDQEKREAWRILVKEIRCYGDGRIEYTLNV